MTNVREDMEKMRNLYTVGGSVIEAATMKNIWKTLKKKKKKKLPPLAIYLKNLKAPIQKDICTSMSIAKLFTIDKRWRQPNCPFMDK